MNYLVAAKVPAGVKVLDPFAQHLAESQPRYSS